MIFILHKMLENHHTQQGTFILIIHYFTQHNSSECKCITIQRRLLNQIKYFLILFK